MAEPDSWEDMEEGSAPAPAPAKPPGFRLNANAPSFSFSPSAPSFTPSYATAPVTARVAPPVVPPGAQPASATYSRTQPVYSQASPVIPSQEPIQQPRSAPTAQSISSTSDPSVRTSDNASPMIQATPAITSVAGSSHAAEISEVPPPQSGAASTEDIDTEAAPSAAPSAEKLAEPNKNNVDTEVPDTKDPAAVNGVAAVLADKIAALDVMEQAPKPVEPEEEEPEEEELERRSAVSTISSEVDKRDHLNLVFIGHVDAGKSTIGGQILYLSGMVDERAIQKFEREAKDKNRESWYMAYIMDTNEEERAKGKTVEVGRAGFDTEKRRYTVLDAPGHKNYVPNMISGASQADVGVLVIAARKGEFETGFERGGQTREHAQLAKTLGVFKLVVVVNKMDDPSVNWDKERFDEIVSKMTPFLRQCGYNMKKDVQFLPISGLMGTNMKERMGKAVCPWWDGPCFFEALDNLEPPLRDPKGPFRMPLIDKFRDMGTVVMGKIESGTIRRGDSLMVMPNKAQVKVVTIYRDADEVEMAKPGENLRVRLSNIEEDLVSPGFVLSSISNPIPAVVEFEGQLQILELLDHKAIFTAGYKAVLHIHSIVEECEIIELIQQIDPKTKKALKKKPLFVKSNAILTARIQVNALICVEKFSAFPQLGRFTLRDEGKTVAIGKVLNLINPQMAD